MVVLDDFLSLKGGSLSEIGRVMVNEYLLRQRIKAKGLVIIYVGGGGGFFLF